MAASLPAKPPSFSYARSELEKLGPRESGDPVVASAYLMATGVASPEIADTARRFCAQQASLDSVQTGLSLPYEIVSTRDGATPSDTRYSRADAARRAPSARLYSRVPRSSQSP